MAIIWLGFLFGMLGMTCAKREFATEETILHENVLFYKEGEMYLSRSRWTLTFVIDINVYEKFIRKLSTDIGNATNLLELISKHYEAPKLVGYRSTFESIKDELYSLKTLNLEIINNFPALKTLGKRSQSSILPFLVSTLSFLIGTVSEADRSGIRTNIDTLDANQQEISHVVGKRLSMLNMTRVQVMKIGRTLMTSLTPFTKLIRTWIS